MVNKEIKVFKFVSYSYDEKSGLLLLNYNAGKYDFTEKITFLGQRRELSEREKTALNRVFRALHIAAGVSYYKTFLCPEMKILTTPLSYNEAVFFKDFYVKGLGEFSYRNDIEIKPDFKAEGAYVKPDDVKLPKGVLVPVGGGKDSILALEMLREKGISPIMFAVGEHKAIKDVMKIAGFPSLSVKRELSPLLFELNKHENTFNGHVPVTGILSFIMVASAIIYGFDTVVMAIERSANTGNTFRNGEEVNHQWSKSFEFENLFSNFIKQNLLPSFNYFSILREYSELEIAKRFSKYKQYLGAFTSCNAAFKIDEGKRVDRWCGICDKCRFVFLALAPFMARDELVPLFGRDLLAEPEQERGYEELLGLSAFRPFECVGEIEESVAALTLLSSLDEWKTAYIVKELMPKVVAKYGDCQEIVRKVFTRSEKHNIPKEFQDEHF